MPVPYGRSHGRLMLLFDLLLVSAGLSLLVTALLWVRVAATHSMKTIYRLDGTERLAERANKRAVNTAVTSSGLTIVLAAAAYLAGRSAGAW